MTTQLKQIGGVLVLAAWVGIIVMVAWKLFKKSEDPKRILFKTVLSLGVMGFVVVSVFWLGAFSPMFAAACGVLLGVVWAPHLGALLARPLTSMYDGGDVQVEERPLYSMAEARRKFGKYPEAIAEVHKQLARFPEDFQGWMLLAEIYGDSCKDLESARECVETILAHNNHTPKNVSYALTRLGDWHLTLGQNPESARAIFQEIINRYPDSEFAHKAEQRIAHTASKEMLGAAANRPLIAMPVHEEHIGLMNKVADPRAPEESPSDAATRLVKHLESHPMDYEAREELARVYATHYQRLDLAQDQLEQLISSPNQSPKHVAHWLNMLADFYIQMKGDECAAGNALHRIVQRYPKSALAANAESRLAYLRLELKKNEKSQVLKLGSYENDIGLKGQVPRR
jgi:outer membrane protein assembly factor BamD (BamD/ComL family)